MEFVLKCDELTIQAAAAAYFRGDLVIITDAATTVLADTAIKPFGECIKFALEVLGLRPGNEAALRFFVFQTDHPKMLPKTKAARPRWFGKYAYKFLLRI